MIVVWLYLNKIPSTNSQYRVPEKKKLKLTWLVKMKKFKTKDAINKVIKYTLKYFIIWFFNKIKTKDKRVNDFCQITEPFIFDHSWSFKQNA